MITYKECLDNVGYNKLGHPPEPIVEYLAYKNGEIRRYYHYSEAKEFSDLMKRIVTNKEEIDAYWIAVRTLNSKAADVFEKAVKEDLAPTMSNELWYLCWNAAYDKSHSDGYDNVAQSAQNFVEFAEKTVAIINNRFQRHQLDVQNYKSKINNGFALSDYFENLKAMLGNESFLRYLGDLDEDFVKRANKFQKDLNDFQDDANKISGAYD